MIFAIIFTLIGCSEDVAEMEKSLQEHTNAEKFKETERNFIKATIESSKDSLSTIEELDYLLSNINFDYPSWEYDMMSIPSQLGSSLNEFDKYSATLTEKQKLKYENTLSNFGEGSIGIYELSPRIDGALDIYDKKELLEIKNELGAIKESFEKTLEQIEIERYEQ